jgi:electron transport complex protein RnfG
MTPGGRHGLRCWLPMRNGTQARAMLAAMMPGARALAAPGLAVVAPAVLAAALAAVHPEGTGATDALAPPAAAAVYATRDQALAETFPGAVIERKRFVLTEKDLEAASALAHVKLESKLVSAYLAWRGDTLAGTAFIDSRTVRTMPGVFMVVVAPDTTIARVEVLAFHEPPDYLPPGRWLSLMTGERLDDRLWPGRDLHHLSGATLTARAVTEMARGALALYQQVVAPALAARDSRAAGEPAAKDER